MYPGLVYAKLLHNGRNMRGMEYNGVRLQNILDIYALRKRLYTVKDIEKADFETLLGNNYSEYSLSKEDQLEFHSNFDSGNLFRVFQGDDKVYYLEMMPDTNSAGHFKWFHFAVSNMKLNEKVKFRLINFRKSELLVCKVYHKSKRMDNFKEVGWRSCPNPALYYQNNDDVLELFDPKVRDYARGKHTLEFTYEFTLDQDIVSFSLMPGYSFEDLQVDTFHWAVMAKKDKKFYFAKKLLCYSLLGRKVFYYEAYRADEKVKISDLSHRKIVVLTARVHPGETPSSYVLKGFMDQFLNMQQKEEAEFLRDNFFFVIIPMLNPDGVAVGNSRVSISGQDLNQVWDNPDRFVHPEIYYSKKLILKLKKENDLLFFCDLHATYRHKAGFLYGANLGKDQILAREFSYLLGTLANLVSFEQCSFNIHKTKKGAANQIIAQETGLVNSYSMQVSTSQTEGGFSIEVEDFERLGKDLCVSLGVYLAHKYPKLKLSPEFKVKSENLWTGIFDGQWISENEIKLTTHDDSFGSNTSLVFYDEKRDGKSISQMIDTYTKTHTQRKGYKQELVLPVEPKIDLNNTLSNIDAPPLQAEKKVTREGGGRLSGEGVKKEGGPYRQEHKTASKTELLTLKPGNDVANSTQKKRNSFSVAAPQTIDIRPRASSKDRAQQPVVQSFNPNLPQNPALAKPKPPVQQQTHAASMVNLPSVTDKPPVNPSNQKATSTIQSIQITQPQAPTPKQSSSQALSSSGPLPKETKASAKNAEQSFSLNNDGELSKDAKDTSKAKEAKRPAQIQIKVTEPGQPAVTKPAAADSADQRPAQSATQSKEVVKPLPQSTHKDTKPVDSTPPLPEQKILPKESMGVEKSENATQDEKNGSIGKPIEPSTKQIDPKDQNQENKISLELNTEKAALQSPQMQQASNLEDLKHNSIAQDAQNKESPILPDNPNPDAQLKAKYEVDVKSVTGAQVTVPDQPSKVDQASTKDLKQETQSLKSHIYTPQDTHKEMKHVTINLSANEISVKPIQTQPPVHAAPIKPAIVVTSKEDSHRESHKHEVDKGVKSKPAQTHSHHSNHPTSGGSSHPHQPNHIAIHRKQHEAHFPSKHNNPNFVGDGSKENPWRFVGNVSNPSATNDSSFKKDNIKVTNKLGEQIEPQKNTNKGKIVPPTSESRPQSLAHSLIHSKSHRPNAWEQTAFNRTEEHPVRDVSPPRKPPALRPQPMYTKVFTSKRPPSHSLQISPHAYHQISNFPMQANPKPKTIREGASVIARISNLPTQQGLRRGLNSRSLRNQEFEERFSQSRLPPEFNFYNSKPGLNPVKGETVERMQPEPQSKHMHKVKSVGKHSMEVYPISRQSTKHHFSTQNQHQSSNEKAAELRPFWDNQVRDHVLANPNKHPKKRYFHGRAKLPPPEVMALDHA